MVLRSFLLRRSVLLDLNVELRLIGVGSSSTARRLRDFAARHEVPYSWTDLDNEDERVAWILDRLGVDRAETPVAVVRGGDVLRDPSEAELGRALGIEEAALTEDSPERRETL